MFGLGFVEILLILAVILLVVGPDKLPEFSRQLGRTMWQLRRTADEFKREVNLTALGVDPDMIRSEYNEIRGIAENCPDNLLNTEEDTSSESSSAEESPPQTEDSTPKSE